jgi:hypothetical protein
MLDNSSNKMMTSGTEDVTVKDFHFAGSGIWRPKTIRAESREVAERLWKEQREPFEQAEEENQTTTNE